MPVAIPVETKAVRQLSDGNSVGTVMGNGPSDQLGFFGLGTPIIQPTGDGGTPGAYTYSAGAVVTALKALGLIAT